MAAPAEPLPGLSLVEESGPNAQASSVGEKLPGVKAELLDTRGIPPDLAVGQKTKVEDTRTEAKQITIKIRGSPLPPKPVDLNVQHIKVLMEISKLEKASGMQPLSPEEETRLRLLNEEKASMDQRLATDFAMTGRISEKREAKSEQQRHGSQQKDETWPEKGPQAWETEGEEAHERCGHQGDFQQTS